MNRGHFVNTNTNSREKQKRGSILLVCLGILALLSLLATTLVFIARQEETASKLYVDETRAQLAAESGIETAIAKLISYQDGLTRLPEAMSTSPESPTIPLRFLHQSSFGTLDLDGDGKKETAGVVSGTYAPNGDSYRLRVRSTQGLLNINDSNSPMNLDTDPYEDQISPERNYLDIPRHMRNPTDPGDRSKDKDPDWMYPDQIGEYNAGDAIIPGKPYPKAHGRLWNIVKELVNLLLPSEPVVGGKSIGQRVADAVFTARKKLNGDRFNNYDEIEAVLVPGILNKDKFDLFKSQITLDSWQDDNVLKPTFQWRISTPPPFVRENLAQDNSGGQLSVTSPAGGETLTPGNTYTVRWNSADPVTVDKVYVAAFDETYSDGFGFGADGKGVPDTGSIEWTIPANMPAGRNYRIRVMKLYPGPIALYYDSAMFSVGMPYTNDMPSPEYFAGDYLPASLTTQSLTQYFGSFQPRPVFGQVYNGSNNNRDIYLYNDMQTPYFELEARSPVNVNDCSMALLQALLRPVKGWYLKEAPLGAEASTAEDWSAPVINQHYGNTCIPCSQFSWFGGFAGLSLFKWINSPWNEDGGLALSGPCAWAKPDKNGFYYYDEFTKAVFDDWSLTTRASLEYCGKSARFGKLEETQLNNTIAFQIAKKIYDRIHGASAPIKGPKIIGPVIDPDPEVDPIEPLPVVKKPFQTWEEFEDFILDMADGDGLNDIAFFNIYQAHAIIANFNPNSRINDYNPNKRFFLHVDKSQLSAQSTELCFLPIGNFEIGVLGQIRDGKGKTKSECNIETSLKVFKILRLDSQADFMQGYDPANAKDSRDFFSASNGYSATKGLAFNGASVDAAHRGNTLQSYPEPEAYDANGVAGKNVISKSEFDGYLMLSLYAPDRAELFSPSATKGFYAGYNGSLRLGYAQGTTALGYLEDISAGPWVSDPSPMTWVDASDGTPWGWDRGAVLPSNTPGARTLARSADDGYYDTLPGSLYPDGSYSDARRGLGYSNKLDPNNWSANGNSNASIQLWVKPGFDTAHSNRARQFFSMGEKTIQTGTGYPDSFSNDFSLYYFSHGGAKVDVLQDNSMPVHDPEMGNGWLSTRAFYFRTSVNHPADDVGMSTTTANQSWRPMSQANTANSLYHFETRQWTHIAMGWDVQAAHTPLPANASRAKFRMTLNGKLVEEVRGSAGGVGWFGAPGKGRSNYVRFGEAGSAYYRNDPADSTFDIIGASSLFEDENYLLEEYSYGRYYNYNDAAYTSPEVDLFAGLDGQVRSLQLASVSWTAYLPLKTDSTKTPNHSRFNDNRNAASSDLYENYNGMVKNDAKYPADPMSPLNGGSWAGNWVPFSIDIMEPVSGLWHYGENLGLTKYLMPNFAGGSMDPNWSAGDLRWTRTGNGKLRFSLHFNLEEGQTLFASPIFDDITFVFKLDSPRIVSWEKTMS